LEYTRTTPPASSVFIFSSHFVSDIFNQSYNTVPVLLDLVSDGAPQWSVLSLFATQWMRFAPFLATKSLRGMLLWQLAGLLSVSSLTSFIAANNSDNGSNQEQCTQRVLSLAGVYHDGKPHVLNDLIQEYFVSPLIVYCVVLPKYIAGILFPPATMSQWAS
jgi:hypothetical protein